MDETFFDWDALDACDEGAAGDVHDSAGDWCVDWLSAESRLIPNPAGMHHGLPLSIDREVGQDVAMTFADDQGMTVYSDTTGDGCVDHISVVGFDGSWSSWQRSADSGVSAAPEILSSQGDIGVHTPPATPTNPMDNWRVDGWECVERGQWG